MNNISLLIQIAIKLGVKLENVHFNFGNSGIEARVDDRTAPFRIFIPKSLIIDCKDIDFNSEVPKARQKLSPLKSKFFEKYFSLMWSKGKKTQILKKIDHIKEHHNIYQNLGLDHFMDFDTSNYAINIVLRDTYKIQHYDKNCLMPIMDFINHSSNGKSYNVSKIGIQLDGLSESDQIYAQYNLHDPLGQYALYLFSEPTNFGYSLPAKIPFDNGKYLVIQRSLGSSKNVGGRLLPQVKVINEKIYLSSLTISSKQYPNKPAKDFAEFASRMNINDYHLIWDRIKANNFEYLLKIYKETEMMDGARDMRTLVFNQLTSISY